MTASAAEKRRRRWDEQALHGVDPARLENRWANSLAAHRRMGWTDRGSAASLGLALVDHDPEVRAMIEEARVEPVSVMHALRKALHWETHPADRGNLPAWAGPFDVV